MTKIRGRRVIKAAVMGGVAGGAGTVVMDLIEYARYRQGGGSQQLIAWETAEGADKWDNASYPGQYGKWVVAKVTGQELPDSWARSTTNIVHWATGLGWGAQFGLLNGGSRRRRWQLAVLFGPTVWLASYVVLPVAKVYKPIWEYDARTLARDLNAHMAYGLVTAAALAVLRPAVKS